MKVFKKILLGLLLLVSTISLSQGFTMGNRVLMGSTIPSEITLTSTSVLASWAVTVTNPGTTLDWTVSGGVTIAKTTINNPTFDFSSNSGTANVLIENVNDLIDFRIVDLSIVTLDVSEAVSFTILLCQVNLLTSLDVSNNTSLDELQCYDNSLTSLNFGTITSLTSIICFNNSLTTLDVSYNTSLASLNCNSNSLSTLDISNNTSLSILLCQGNSFSSGVLDQIYIDLDNNGVSNGTLIIDAGRTAASDTARANLITKNWNITEI